jgi:hypothetical protein
MPTVTDYSVETKWRVGALSGLLAHAKEEIRIPFAPLICESGGPLQLPVDKPSLLLQPKLKRSSKFWKI